MPILRDVVPLPVLRRAYPRLAGVVAVRLANLRVPPGPSAVPASPHRRARGRSTPLVWLWVGGLKTRTLVKVLSESFPTVSVMKFWSAWSSSSADPQFRDEYSSRDVVKLITLFDTIYVTKPKTHYRLLFRPVPNLPTLTRDRSR